MSVDPFEDRAAPAADRGPAADAARDFGFLPRCVRRMLEHALRAHRAGLRVLPPEQDGSKKPIGGSWKHAQTEMPSEDQVVAWYAAGLTGLGYVCGAVSGNLEVIDFECRLAVRRLGPRGPLLLAWGSIPRSRSRITLSATARASSSQKARMRGSAGGVAGI
jgi:hypothetical protein